MILPNYKIKELCDPSRDQLIHLFKEENLRASSYDLTVGYEYYLGQDNSISKLNTEFLKEKQSFCIPPHAVCFILASETIKLPRNITAKVSLRMSHIYAGLVLTAQPPFDPGYKGKVIVMLHNLSSDAVHMKQGDRLVTIEFMSVDGNPEGNKVHRSVESLEAQLSKPIVSSLSEVSRRSDEAHNKVNLMAGQMLVFAALIVAVLAVPGFFSFNSLIEKSKDQDAKIESMADQLKKLNDTLSRQKIISEIDSRRNGAEERALDIPSAISHADFKNGENSR